MDTSTQVAFFHSSDSLAFGQKSVYSPTQIPRFQWENRICCSMSCLNETSLLVKRIIGTAVDGLDSWRLRQIIDTV